MSASFGWSCSYYSVEMMWFILFVLVSFETGISLKLDRIVRANEVNEETRRLILIRKEDLRFRAFIFQPDTARL